MQAHLTCLVGSHIGGRGTLQPEAGHYGFVLPVGLKVEVPLAVEAFEDGAPVTPFVGGHACLLHQLAVGGVELYLHIDTGHGLVLARVQCPTVEHEGTFGIVLHLEGGVARHLLPVVSAPALHEHQAVEGGTVLLIVGLEVIFRVFDVAFQLRREQHVGAHIIAVTRTVVGSVTHGEREGMGVLLLYLQAQRHLLEGGIGLLVGGDGHGSCGEAVVDEEHTGGMEHAAGIEEGKLVHTRGELAGGDGADRCPVAHGERVYPLAFALAHQGISEQG